MPQQIRLVLDEALHFGIRVKPVSLNVLLSTLPLGLRRENKCYMSFTVLQGCSINYDSELHQS